MENKKELIINSAIESFRTNGIERTKISDIVKHAGIAQGTFYLYFPSKLAVMPAIAKTMVNKMVNTVKKEVDIKSSLKVKIEQLINTIFNVIQNEREVFALLYAGLASTEHLKEWESIYQPFYDWLIKLLELAKINGEIQVSLKSNIIAKLIIGLIESAAEQVYLYDNPTIELVDEHKVETLSFIKNAIGLNESK